MSSIRLTMATTLHEVCLLKLLKVCGKFAGVVGRCSSMSYGTALASKLCSPSHGKPSQRGGWRPDLLHHPREIWSSRLFFPVPAEVLRQDIYAVDQEQLQGAVGAVASIGHRKAIKSQEEQATKSEQTDSSLRVLETRGEDAKEEEKQEAQRREAEVMQETIDIIECPVDETESIATASPDTSLSFDGIEPLESSCSSDSEDPLQSMKAELTETRRA